MTLADLTAEIRDREGRLAYGSETSMWGDFLSRLEEVTGVSPLDVGTEQFDACEVDGDEAAWWIKAYDLYESSESDYDDLQSLYDAVSV